MRYRYRIYHREEGKDPVEQHMHPFTEEQQLREYISLPSYLSGQLHDKGITVTCTPDEIPVNGVIVELESNKSEAELDSCLVKCLVAHNYQVNGLCLVIDKRVSK